MVAKHTLTGTIENAGGPAKGVLVFRPSQTVRHSVDGVYLMDVEHRVDLNDTGSFSISLYDSADAGWDVPWNWECTIRIIEGTSSKISFEMTQDEDIASVATL